MQKLFYAQSFSVFFYIKVKCYTWSISSPLQTEQNILHNILEYLNMFLSIWKGHVVSTL